jgi:methionine-rich copper-binding protein CopC
MPSAGRKLHHVLRAASAVILVGCALLAVPTGAARADVCGTGGNPIACENSKPGTPQSQWEVSANEGSTIQGFANPFSVDLGATINLKIQTAATSYKIDIYRMGYYGGDGARLITSLTPNLPVSQNQPACNTNTNTGLVDCSNWGASASWTVPTDLVSGVYFAHIYRTDGTSDENQISFVVRDDASHSNILFKTNDETWQAYNDWGGYSLYTGEANGTVNSHFDPGRAQQVSYDRPFATRFDTPYGQDYFFYAEFPMIEFMEENGYDVSYIDQGTVASPQGPSLIEQHKIFTAAGHDEYWSGSEVANVTAARNAGVNMAFFTGNEIYWKTRFAADAAGESDRTLITYKESLDSAQSDPSDPPTWTGAWDDPRFSPPDDGGHPQNALTGQLWTVNAGTSAITVPSQYSALRFWRNTAVANLASGQSATLANETLGYEWDQDVDNGFRPAGEFDLSSTTMNAPQVMTDYQEDLAAETVTHHLSLYRASSGALVFGAGTVQWAWGLNSNHDGDAQPATSVIMQQATVNLLADMGNVQPTTLMTGLVQATASTDTTPPASAITAPASGAAIANGSSVTVSGTATDGGGGVVAGVEVSTDGGSTWHPVTTMSPAATSVSWSYTWSATGAGNVTIQSRATDDGGNIETPGSGVTVAVNCPCGLYGQTYTPSVTSENDSTAYELGVKFTSSASGWIAGVRFYKGAGNGGTHTGSLWSASGSLLATGTFSNETASGWQTLLFTSPVQIAANTQYVASYYDPEGHYADDLDQFYPGMTGSTGLQPLDSTPLQAVRATATVGNGVFNVGGPGFPSSAYQGTGYGVDVIFDTTQPAGAPPAVTGETPAPNSTDQPVTTNPSVTFSEPVTPSTVTMTMTDASGSIAGSVALDSTHTVATFTPSSALPAGTAFTVTVGGETDQFGQTGPTETYSFRTANAGSTACPCTIWPSSATPGTVNSGDSGSVTLGVRFTASTNGTISGIRFYKSAANLGTHTGTLWTASGTELATGTFSGESAQGWQELDFATPVQITAGTTYVASYFAPKGHYSDDDGGLASAVSNGPLTALSGGGVYAYGSSETFPTHSWANGNYWVDVVFEAASGGSPPTVSSALPSSGANSVPVSSGVSVTFSEPVQSGTAVLSVTSSGGQTVPGSTALDSTGKVLTFTPSSPLTAGATYSVSTTATGTTGAAMAAPVSWKFTTAGASACPCTLFESDATPTVAASTDTSPVTLGVRFTPDTSGWITGVRFYKGSGNVGAHVGNLWTASGTLLGAAAFSGETASGWQTVQFQNPVAVTAGTTYVAGYYAPDGHYAEDSGYFNSKVDNSPLHAPATSSGGNGVYAYGNDKFPSSTYGGDNYWVDPIFTTTAPTGGGSSQCPCSIWSSASVPSITSANDNGSVELGVKFTAAANGWISGIRFYKGSANTGTHVGSLWDTSGDLLGSVTFANETASGWQEADFSSPIAVTAGTTYIASYLAPNGEYSEDDQGLTSAVSNGPLTALASGTSGGNGVYLYTHSPSLPTNTYNSANYWVDVVFTETAS